MEVKMETIKKAYTVKEILLGLREEYVKFNKEMQELKKYIDIIDDEHCDFYISCASISREKSENELGNQIKFKNNKNLLLYVTLLKKRYILNHLLKPSVSQYILFQDANKQYFSCNDNINILKRNLFSDDVTKLLNSDFVENSNYSVIEYLESDDRLYMNFSLNSIEVVKFQNNTNNAKFRCFFEPIVSNLMVSNDLEKSISQDFLDEMLHMEVPITMLNDYFISLIGENDLKHLTIDFDDSLRKQKKIKLSLYKNENGFVLDNRRK